MSLEILLGAIWVSLDSISARGPGSGACLTNMTVCPLEGLQQPQSLLYRSTYLVIVDLHGTDHTSGVYT